MSANGANRRRRVGERGKSVCAVLRSREGGEREASFEAKYYALLERVAEMGMVAIEGLTEKQRYALEVILYLRQKHGDLKVSSTSLYTLKPEVMREGMDYLNTILGNNIRRKDIVHEVFRGPRDRRRPGLETFVIDIP